MGKTGAASALSASAASFVVVIVEKSKFSAKSEVCKVKGLSEIFSLTGLRQQNTLFIYQNGWRANLRAPSVILWPQILGHRRGPLNFFWIKQI